MIPNIGSVHLTVNIPAERKIGKNVRKRGADRCFGAWHHIIRAQDPAAPSFEEFLIWFTLISWVINFGLKLAKINQLAGQNVH